MIKITFHKNSDGALYSFTSSGHAGYDSYGKDIICSAVSVLAINTANAIESFTKDSIEAEVDESEGYLHFEFTSSVSSESVLLMNTLLLGVSGISEEYGSKYVKVTVTEENM